MERVSTRVSPATDAFHTPNSGILFSWMSCEVKGYLSLHQVSAIYTGESESEDARDVTEELPHSQFPCIAKNNFDTPWGYLEPWLDTSF